ncbi:MAG: hypothetical protein ACRBBP_05470 [Bdellovibrionales bacterium]
MPFLNRTPIFAFLMFLNIYQVSATTISPTFNLANLSPGQRIQLESLSLECGLPGVDCPKVPLESILEIQYVKQNEKYSIGLDTDLKAAEAGLLIIVEPPKAEDRSFIRFIPMTKVELSPDSNFYMCPKSKEYKLRTDFNASAIGLSTNDVSDILSIDLQPQTFICKCFWIPKSFFTELGIDKIKKEQSDQEDIPNDETIDKMFPETDSLKPIVSKPTVEAVPVLSAPISFWPIEHFSSPTTPTVEPPKISPVPIGGRCGLFAWACLFKPKEKIRF